MEIKLQENLQRQVLMLHIQQQLVILFHYFWMGNFKLLKLSTLGPKLYFLKKIFTLENCDNYRKACLDESPPGKWVWHAFLGTGRDTAYTVMFHRMSHAFCTHPPKHLDMEWTLCAASSPPESQEVHTSGNGLVPPWHLQVLPTNSVTS